MTQELATIPKHLSSLDLYVYVLQVVVCPFAPILLVIVWSVRLPITDSDNPFRIFKIFLRKHLNHANIHFLITVYVNV
jgi:hypothetical protein